MPQMLPAAAAWVTAATVTATGITSLAFAQGVYAAATVALNVGVAAASTAVASLLQPSVGAGGRMVDIKSDINAPISGLMGRCSTGGRQLHMRTWGKENIFFSHVIHLSLGPIEGVESFTANGAAVTFPGAQGKATSGPYVDKMWQTYKLGLPTDGALGPPTGQPEGAPGLDEWTAAHKTSGHALCFWTMRTNSKFASYEQGVPDPLWIGKWMKLWDPRFDSTWPGGSGPQRRDDWTTWAWTENPYIHALAWVRGHHKNLTGGLIDRSRRIAGVGAPDAAIDIAGFVEGANIADANDWKICGEWTTADDKWHVLAAMLQAGGGVPLNRGAQISCKVSTPRVSIYTYTGADLIGSANIRVMTSRRDRINTIVPRYREEAQKWEVVSAGAVTGSTWLAEDGDEIRSREITYSYVPAARQAAQLAAYDIAATRENITGGLPSKTHLLGLRAGDCFTVNEPQMGLINRKVVVGRRAYDPQSGVVTLEIESETDGKHDFALGRVADPPPTPGLDVVDLAPATPDAADWAVTVRAADADGTLQPGLIVAGVVNSERAATVLIEYALDAGGPWIQAYAGPGTAETFEINGLASGTAYYVGITYLTRTGRPSTRLVLGPYTTSGLSPTAETPGGITITSATLVKQVQQDGHVRTLLNVTWTSATKGVGYHVEITPSWDASALWIEPADGLSLKNYGISTGYSYSIRVRAVSKTGTFGPWSSAVSTGTVAGDTVAPGQVSSPAVTAGPRLVHIEFDLPADADYSHQRLYRHTSATYVGSSLIGNVFGTAYDDVTVTPGTLYYYWGRSEDASGNLNATYTYLGAATPRFVTGGLDTDPLDPEISNRPRVLTDNRVDLSDFELRDAGWDVLYNPSALAVTKSVGEASGRRYAEAAFTATVSGQIVSVGTPSAYRFRVEPGERLSVQVRLGASGPVATVTPAIRFYTGQSGSVVSTVNIDAPMAGPQSFGTQRQTFVTVPSGAYWAELESYVESSGAGAITNRLCEPMVTPASAVQTAHPPYSPGSAATPARVQYIDNAGRVVDGRGLPINVSGYVLDPVVQIAAGSPPDTSIGLVGGTVTLQGGETISLPSGSISGLSADTTYAVFRDLQAGAYVAVASGATGYFTDASRYLRLGAQTTAADAGGTYTPPTPAPPGYLGGGGLADRYEDSGPI